jgi:sugar phosphate isomerase/epimerase
MAARLSINEITTFRWTFEEDVNYFKAAGIEGIGVWRQKISDFGEDKGCELLSDSGLAVSNLLWAGGFTGSDGRTFRESIEDAVEAIELAQDLRAGCLVVYSGARAGHTHNHARRLLKDALGELLPVALECRVTLAIEPMHAGCSSDWTFLTSLDDTVGFLDSLNFPEVKLVFDTYHLGHDRSVLSRLDDLAPRIAVVHLADGKEPPEREQDRCRLGDGRLPLKEIVASLAAAGYDGFYDVELIGPEIEASSYHQLVEQSKQAFSRLVGSPEA